MLRVGQLPVGAVLAPLGKYDPSASYHLDVYYVNIHHFLVALGRLAEVVGAPHSATWTLAKKFGTLATTGMLSAGDHRVLGR